MIALYYCYTPFSLDVEQHILYQEDICKGLELKGRIRVSEEGINGVLSGSKELLEKYEKDVKKKLSVNLARQSSNAHDHNFSDERNSDFEFDVKYCHLRPDIPEESQLFETLSIKQTREVVSLHEMTNKPSESNVDSRKNGKGDPWRRRRRRRIKHKITDNIDENKNVGDSDKKYTQFPTATHLKPEEWHCHLHESSDNNVSSSQNVNKVLIDARNIYESNVGYFHIPGIPTILTNTRKYSSLPQILNSPQVRNELRGKEVYMYCTGGVRCERASQYLASLAENKNLWLEDENKVSKENETHGDTHCTDGQSNPPVKIYQLEGGIQRYLEVFGEMQTHVDHVKSKKDLSNENETKNHDSTFTESNKSALSQEKLSERNCINVDSELPPILSSTVLNGNDSNCLYKGKNFVFDPRRTDPKIGPNPPGKCIICSSPHDDYDNGYPPSAGKEARCCRCRVLVLVCNDCRIKVNCWGENNNEKKHLNICTDTTPNVNVLDSDLRANNYNSVLNTRLNLFCGKGGKECTNQGNNVDDIRIIS